MRENHERGMEPRSKNPQVVESAPSLFPSLFVFFLFFCPKLPWQRWAFDKLTTCTNIRTLACSVSVYMVAHMYCSHLHRYCITHKLTHTQLAIEMTPNSC